MSDSRRKEGVVTGGDSEPIWHGNFAQPNAHTSVVFLEAVIKLPCGLAEALYTIDTVYDGLGNDVEVDDAVE